MQLHLQCCLHPSAWLFKSRRHGVPSVNYHWQAGLLALPDYCGQSLRCWHKAQPAFHALSLLLERCNLPLKGPLVSHLLAHGQIPAASAPHSKSKLGGGHRSEYRATANYTFRSPHAALKPKWLLSVSLILQILKNKQALHSQPLILCFLCYALYLLGFTSEESINFYLLETRTRAVA